MRGRTVSTVEVDSAEGLGARIRAWNRQTSSLEFPHARIRFGLGTAYIGGSVPPLYALLRRLRRVLEKGASKVLHKFGVTCQ